MKLYIEKTNERKEITLKTPKKASEIIKELGINEETVIITRKNNLITKDDMINDEDEIELLSIISGG